MHLYIAGIGGTFMAGLARLALAKGWQVRGCDQAVYPPMSLQLDQMGVMVDEGFSADHLRAGADGRQLIVGNALSRGNPLVEEALSLGLPYTSGPAWLADHVLADRTVLAVAGTHGKTTAAAMLSWILQSAPTTGSPGFLIGGLPNGFSVSASLGESPLFVIEADEYDTAFFDKRPKFMHYRPTVLVLNNLEFDHADVYDNLEMIKRQFHYLIRTVPGRGAVLYNKDDADLQDVIERGVWTPTETFAVDNPAADWNAAAGDSGFELFYHGRRQGACEWDLVGAHNTANAAAAIAAACHAGVSADRALAALASFSGVKRRLEKITCSHGVTVYDDFAHHPTEIAASLSAGGTRLSKGRMIAVFEPRSNTMRMGRHNARLREAFAAADQLFFYQPPSLGWDAQALFSPGSERPPDGFRIFSEPDVLLARLLTEVRPGDRVIFMSSGDFSGLPRKFASQLQCLNA